MVRVADCHAGVLGSNPGGPRYFPLGITSFTIIVIVNALFGVVQMLSGEKDHITSEMRVVEKGACKKE